MQRLILTTGLIAGLCPSVLLAQKIDSLQNARQAADRAQKAANRAQKAADLAAISAQKVALSSTKAGKVKKAQKNAAKAFDAALRAALEADRARAHVREIESVRRFAAKGPAASSTAATKNRAKAVYVKAKPKQSLRERAAAQKAAAKAASEAFAPTQIEVVQKSVEDLKKQVIRASQAEAKGVLEAKSERIKALALLKQKSKALANMKAATLAETLAAPKPSSTSTSTKAAAKSTWKQNIKPNLEQRASLYKAEQAEENIAPKASSPKPLLVDKEKQKLKNLESAMSLQKIEREKAARAELKRVIRANADKNFELASKIAHLRQEKAEEALKDKEMKSRFVREIRPLVY